MFTTLLKDGHCISFSQYFPDRFVRKSLGKFSIKCTNEDCSWIGNVEQLTLHLAECELTKLQCEHCNELLVASEVIFPEAMTQSNDYVTLFPGQVPQGSLQRSQDPMLVCGTWL